MPTFLIQTTLIQTDFEYCDSANKGASRETGKCAHILLPAPYGAQVVPKVPTSVPQDWFRRESLPCKPRSPKGKRRCEAGHFPSNGTLHCEMRLSPSWLAACQWRPQEKNSRPNNRLPGGIIPSALLVPRGGGGFPFW